jgi:hypothetical protein
MSWTNIIDKVDKEKRNWAKCSTEHLEAKTPSEMWVEIQHD